MGDGYREEREMARRGNPASETDYRGPLAGRLGYEELTIGALSLH